MSSKAVVDPAIEFRARRGARHPVRIVHLGLGAFHRAHQAWYTQRVNDLGGSWGIESFTGRSPSLALAMDAQDDLYTLVERGPSGDRASLIESISAATDGSDATRWRQACADPKVAIVTLTVTEAGYRLTRSGDLDLADGDVLADIDLLRNSSERAATTAPGRIVDGLRARMLSSAGPLALVSCDNLPGNGRATRGAVLGMAERVDAGLTNWIGSHVSFVSTVVDRITPASTDDDRTRALALTGLRDAVPVVTEPFSEWVLSGDFPAGRPPWEAVGARFVDDIAPFEQRKLWLLNAGHSLLAYRGLIRGHRTIDEAMLDPDCVNALGGLWDEARDILPFDEAELDEAFAALRYRFGNTRIRHLLSQIATNGSHKLVQRVIDPIRRRRHRGEEPGEAQAGVLAAWALHLLGPERADPGADDLVAELAGRKPEDQSAAVIAFLAPDLAGDRALVDSVATQIVSLNFATN